MDTSDCDISFDACGVCNHHLEYLQKSRYACSPEDRTRKLEAAAELIRNSRGNKQYDCVLGLSGGLDSSYLALLAHRLGLRPLAIHLDNSWNSELAVDNIQKIVQKLNLDLKTVVLDWENFRELQLAFLKASVANVEVPTDHAIFASLYRCAAAEGLQFVLSGNNIATESILPPSWGYNFMDLRHIKSIHRRFAKRPLGNYPTLSLPRFLYYRYGRRIQKIPLLNYVDFNKKMAIQELQSEFGWRDYGSKHGESRFTRFFQGYILPKKFGFDKRRAHYSSLIVSGQMTRSEALELLKQPPLAEAELSVERQYVLKKLGLSEQEFSEIMKQAPKRAEEYPSNAGLLKIFAQLKREKLQRSLEPYVPQIDQASL